MYKNRKDMRNIPAILVALLLAASCSSAPSDGSAVSGQPTTPTPPTTTPTTAPFTTIDMGSWTARSVPPHTRPHEPKPKCAKAIADAQSRMNARMDAEPDWVSGVSPDDMTDADFDGLLGWEERFLGTDSWNPDTDGDGFSDGRECTELDSDPLDPSDPDLGEGD
jgi:hypothetical protein